jgi:hypothetical protein
MVVFPIIFFYESLRYIIGVNASLLFFDIPFFGAKNTQE